MYEIRDFFLSVKVFNIDPRLSQEWNRKLDFCEAFPNLALASFPLVRGRVLHLVQLSLHRVQLAQNFSLNMVSRFL
jgi:hypothetical protein